MADPREWISRVKAEEPPDLWSGIRERTTSTSHPALGRAIGRWPGRPAAPRRAALVTGVAAGILALTLVAVGLRGRPSGEDRPTPPPEPTALDAVHQRFERVLSDLWILETHLFLLRGELGAAREELEFLRDTAGPEPTDGERRRIEETRERIEAYTRSIEATSAEVHELRRHVEQLRERRSGQLPPSDVERYPDVATVTCEGDGEGGTHVSTPVVRAQVDGVHVRVVNRLGNESVVLVVDDSVAVRIRADSTTDVVLSADSSGDLAIACTYDEPPFEFPRPTHPLWIAPTAR
jgi:hypothetical protein